MTPEHHDELAAALDTCLAALERGEDSTVERVCLEKPHLAEQIRASVRMAEELAQVGLQPTTTNGDSPKVPSAGFGRFQIRGTLGAGGMATVYRAHDPKLGRDLALKVLPAAMLASPAAQRRFEREMRLLAQVRHPHIVALLDAGRTDEGQPWFAMDLVEGESLAARLARLKGRRPSDLRAVDLRAPTGKQPGGDQVSSESWVVAVLQMTMNVANALHASHGLGVVHRDVKPSNILLDAAGHPYLVDFGIARSADQVTGTVTHGRAGTLRYMAPEQVDGRLDAIGPRSDVFGLGACLYEALTLEPAFDGQTEAQICQRILSEEPLSPRRYNPNISRDVETTCSKAMRKSPEDRYGSARAFADDIMNLLSLRPIEARPVSRITRAARFVRRSWLVSAVLALVTVALAWLLVQEKSRDHQADMLLRQARERFHSKSGPGAGKQDLCVSALKDLNEARRLRPDRDDIVDFRDLVRAELRRADAASLSLVLFKSVQTMEHLVRTAHAAEHATVEAHERDTMYSTLRRGFNEVLSQDPTSGGSAEELLRLEQLRRQDLTARGSLVSAAPEGQTLIVDGTPPGAEVFLFRYEDESEAATPRLVPVPHSARTRVCPHGFTPGRPALVLESVLEGSAAATQGLRAGDLILRVSRHDITESKYEAAVLSCTGVPTNGLDLGVLVNGEMREIHLAAGTPTGLSVRATAYPLALTSANRLGVLPVGPMPLPTGSWLLVIRKDGFEHLRLPVSVDADPPPTRIRADLLAKGSTPAGFVWIPPGSFVQGGDAEAKTTSGRTASAREETWLDGYWIQRAEVTVADYLEFVNDGETLDLIRSAMLRDEWTRVPRVLLLDSPRHSLCKPSWQQAKDGRLQTDWDPRSPIRGISCEDADAYARWQSQRATERGSPWRYRLPTAWEWEKAARGGDGRFYVWGNVGSAGMCWSHDDGSWEGSGRVPLHHLNDESPFDVHDMASSTLEWCVGLSIGQRLYRGGGANCSFKSADTKQHFRVASVMLGVPWRPGDCDGFRLVAWRAN